MVLRNLIFQTEVVEQRFRTGMVPHHDEQASENGNPERHVQLPCNMLPPYLCLLIAVTFSTPTGDYTSDPDYWRKTVNRPAPVIFCALRERRQAQGADINREFSLPPIICLPL